MILFAYAIALLAVAWAVASRGRPWILRLDERRQQRIRLAGMAIAVLVGVAGVAVIWVQATGEAADQAVLPWTIGAALIVGGVVHGAGPGPGITGVTRRGIGARRPGCQLTGVGAAGAWLGR